MTLQPEERKAIVTYRLNKAKETLKEVKATGELGYWSLAANRLYYSAYYASVALLIHNGIETSTHKSAFLKIFGVVGADIFEQILKVKEGAMRALQPMRLSKYAKKIRTKVTKITSIHCSLCCHFNFFIE